jgi:hypothetical protein
VAVDQLPRFGVRLKRLLDARGAGAAPPAGIDEVLAGDEPSPLLLRRLAPALGLHRSDLFVIAGRPVPEDLAPPDPAAYGAVGSLAWPLTYVPGIAPELRTFVAGLPRQPPVPGRVRAGYAQQDYPDTAGGLIARLLHNRNLDRPAAARYLYGVGRGPMLSASTIRLIGLGRKALTPGLLAGLAAVIDIGLRDLAALTGIEPAGGPGGDATEVAALVWDMRRLTVAQLDQVGDRAHALRHERAGEIAARLRCRCPGRRDGRP